MDYLLCHCLHFFRQRTPAVPARQGHIVQAEAVSILHVPVEAMQLMPPGKNVPYALRDLTANLVLSHPWFVRKVITVWKILLTRLRALMGLTTMKPVGKSI